MQGPQEYEVTRVDGSHEWSSNYGPMVGWDLSCRNVRTGAEKAVSVNSKPGNEYKVGQKFWAEYKGERAGVVQLKRVQPPQGGGGYRGSPQGSGRAQSAPQGQSGPIPFAEAVEVLAECIRTAEAIGGTPEHGTTLYLGWLRGDVAKPPLGGQRRAPQGGSYGSDEPPPPDEGDYPESTDEIPF